MKKEAVITFYQIFSAPIPTSIDKEVSQKDIRLRICSGSAYVQHLLGNNFDNIFLSKDFPCPIEEWKEILSKYDKIYFSAIHSSDLYIVAPLVDKRWVIGGPLIQSDCFDLIRNSFSSATLCTGLFEDYLGQPLSDTYIEYWNDWVENKEFSQKISTVLSYASIGSGCYWGRCIFCSTHKKNIFYDRDYEKIILSLKGYKKYISAVHLCKDTVNVRQLRRLLNIKSILLEKKIELIMYLRGDEIIYRFLDSECQDKDFRGLQFLIGLESFSQEILDSLNKGLNVKTVLNVIKFIADRGGRSIVTLMNHYPNYTMNIVQDSLDNIRWLKNNVKSGLSIINSGRIEWPTEKEAAIFGEYENYGSIDFHKSICDLDAVGPHKNLIPVNLEANHNFPNFHKEFVVSKIPVGSEVWEANRIICQELSNSFYNHGKPYESLIVK